MRQLFLVLSVDLCVVVYFTSAGILDSFLTGLSESSSNNNNQPAPHSNEQAAIAASNTNKWHTNSSSFYLPTEDGGQLRIDLCEGDILVPLSFDGKGEVIIKSTNFPFKRSSPLICSWNVKVTKNCWRGMVKMKINGYSRLADLNGCLHGYYTVSPFMNDTKICGRINTVPDFEWYVENQQPENVTITLRHAGLNDGFAEGLGFTLSGECLPNTSDMTFKKANESYSSWLQQLSMKQSTPEGGPMVFAPSDTGSLQPENYTSVEFTTVSPTLENSTIVTTINQVDHTTLSVELPVLQPNTSNNQSWADSNPENVTISVFLPSNNVTEIPAITLPSTTIAITVSPVNLTDLRDHSSSMSINSSVTIPSTTENPTNLTLAHQTNNASLADSKHPPSSVNISAGIPWLILKKPQEEKPNLSTDYPEPPIINLQSPDHQDELLADKKRPAIANSAPEVILIDVVFKPPNRINKPEKNWFQETSSNNGSVKIVPIRSPSKSSPLSKRQPATTIKASSNNRPNFYTPPRRNPLLTFDD